jgi:cell division transport system permease protein
MLAAALTVANVVRLALYARRDEIEIMQLVGAPQAYIRGPFVMEGVLQGGIGAVAALALLAAVFLVTHARYLVPLATSVNLASIRFLSPELCVMLFLGGMVVGSLGGLVASGRT